jgi:hypothetical protein
MLYIIVVTMRQSKILYSRAHGRAPSTGSFFTAIHSQITSVGRGCICCGQLANAITRQGSINGFWIMSKQESEMPVFHRYVALFSYSKIRKKYTM